MRFRQAILLLALAVVAGACGGSSTGASGKLQVVTTVSPITNIVQNIAGDLVDVTGLVPEGTNSHTFEPAPSDARLLAEADVVIVNGLHLEEPTVKLVVDNVRKGVQIIRLGDRTITPDEYIYDFSFPKEEGDPNPHLWTNPLYGKSYAQIVLKTLSILDTANGAAFSRNYAAFAAKIDALDQAVRRATSTVPEQRRTLLTYHDSFPYFAREYGWKVIGAIQPSDFSEPTPREVARLIDQIERLKVPAIFGSEVFPSPVLQQIAKETGARYVDELRDDDLPGKPGDANHSYLGLLVFDFKTIVGALGGDASAFANLDVANGAGGSAATYRE